MARSCRLALLGLVTTTLGTVRVQGQEAPAPVRLEYRAPAECPSREDFEARVLARTGKTGLYSDGRAAFELFDVELTPTPERTRGRLTTHARGAYPNVREIQAGTCREAVDALALIVALTLDPTSVKAVSEPPGTAGSGGAAGSAGAPEESKRPPDGKDSGQGGTKPEGSSDRVAPLPPPESDTGPGAPPRFEFMVSWLPEYGVAPKFVPLAGEASVGVLVPIHGPHGLLIRGGVRYALPVEEVTPEGKATFEWLSGHLALCPHLGLSDEWFVGACANAELGQLQATGSETNNGTSSKKFWASIGPGGLVRWHFFWPMFAHGSAEADFPLARQRYVLGPLEVHETPVLVFRAELGIGVQL